MFSCQWLEKDILMAFPFSYDMIMNSKYMV